MFESLDAGEAFFVFKRIKSCIELNNGTTKLVWAVESVNVYHLLFSRSLLQFKLSSILKILADIVLIYLEYYQIFLYSY